MSAPDTASSDPATDPTSESAPGRPRPGASVTKRDTATGLADPAERGKTFLAERVVEKIAAHAALDIDDAAGLSKQIAGRSFGARTVRVRAEVDGRIASLRLELAVEYPASARQTTRAVRRHVSERVATLCDLTVDHIDVGVEVLRRPDEDRRRVQ